MRLGFLHVFLWLDSSPFKAVNNIPLSEWTTVYLSPTGRNCPWKQLTDLFPPVSNVKKVACVSLKGASNSDSDQTHQVPRHPGGQGLVTQRLSVTASWPV